METKKLTEEAVPVQAEARKQMHMCKHKRMLSGKAIKWIVILLLLFGAALYFVPFPVFYHREYRAAEYANGSYKREIRLTMNVWKLNYLFKDNQYRGKMTFEYPNGEVHRGSADTYEQSFYWLDTVEKIHGLPVCFEIENSGALSLLDLYWYMKSNRLFIQKKYLPSNKGVILFCTSEEEFMNREVYREMYDLYREVHPDEPGFDEAFPEE